MSLVLILYLFNNNICSVSALSPYSILGIERTATDAEVQAQYRKMRSKNRRSRFKKNMMKEAYDQIMVERKFKNQRSDQEETSTFTKIQPKGPVVINEEYVYGYKLNDEFDDGRYFQAHFNETKHIFEKTKNSQENRQAASVILMIGGVFLKLLPCIIIFFFCRSRGRENVGLSDVLGRAARGYRRLGRNISGR